MIGKLVSKLRRAAPEVTAAALPPRGKAAGRLFASVTIVPGPTCCHEVRKLRRKRILAGEAPRLPLSECTQPESCLCSFEKHGDRRDGDENRRILGLWQPGFWKDGGERRKTRGRRSTDR